MTNQEKLTSAERQGEQNRIIGELKNRLAHETDPNMRRMLRREISGHISAWYKFSTISPTQRKRSF